jgi:hypothetical protein
VHGGGTLSFWFADTYCADNVGSLTIGIHQTATQDADMLIGSMPNMVWQIPPVTQSGTFFSPTRFIRLFNEAPGQPMVAGNDYWTYGDCNGVEFHVVASCTVNDTNVPFSDHFYWYSGTHCFEEYSWRNATIDLGAPGYFSIEVVADNALGLGLVHVLGWDIWTVGEVPPAFEVLSATFDKSIYQNGVDTVHLTVVTKSNWGTSSNLTTAATLYPPVSSGYSMGEDQFSLAPGGEHTSVLSWQIPEVPSTWECDALVTFKDGNQTIASLPINRAFMGRVLSQEQVIEGQGLVETCYLDDPSEQCKLAILGALPLASSVSHMMYYVDRMCVAGQLHRQGKWSEGNAYLLSALGEFAQIWLSFGILPWGSEVIGGIYEGVDLYGSLASAVEDCKGTELGDLFFGTGVRMEPGAFADSMSIALQQAWSAAPFPFADALIVEGSTSVRVEADSSWADADSTGLNYAKVVRIGDNGSITLASLGVRRFLADPGANPHSAARFQITSRSDQTLQLALLHRTGTGDLTRIRYDGLAVTDSTRIEVAVADTTALPRLNVDLDGNGIVDFEWYPGAAAIDGEPAQPDGDEAVLTLASAPNPTAGRSSLVLRSAVGLKGVTISVYDVAGRVVRTLAVGDLSPGVHQVAWDGRGADGEQMASGIYYCEVAFAGGRGPGTRIVVLQ